MVRCRAIDVFLAFSTDRLTREMLHLMLLPDECDRHQVQLRFVRENYDPTPEGKMLMQMRGAINEFERLKIKERTTRGRRQKARDGFVHSVGKRFGYNYLGKTAGQQGRTAHRPGRGQGVRRIFDEYMRGKPVYQIRAGHSTATASRAPAADCGADPVIRQILGIRCTCGRMNGPGGIPVPCPAIISEETFALAQAQRTRSKAANVGRPTRQYLLTGRLWCAQCGRRCTTSPGTAGQSPYYRCGNVDHKTHMRRLRRSGRAPIAHRSRRLGARRGAAITDPDTLYGLIEAYRARFAETRRRDSVPPGWTACADGSSGPSRSQRSRRALRRCEAPSSGDHRGDRHD